MEVADIIDYLIINADKVERMAIVLETNEVKVCMLSTEDSEMSDIGLLEYGKYLTLSGEELDINERLN